MHIMKNVDTQSLLTVEAKIQALRDKALLIVQREFPDCDYIVDSYTTDDFCHYIYDYPGTYYPMYRLPDGKAEAQVIAEMVDTTITCLRKIAARQ